MSTRDEISRVCDDLKELLLQKNAKYGDSALDPVRTFSKASAVEQILVRIDDKLSRIQRGAGIVGDDEDVIQDLMGYLVLLTIALKREDNKANVRFAEPLEERVVLTRTFDCQGEQLTPRQMNAHGVVPNVYD